MQTIWSAIETFYLFDLYSSEALGFITSLNMNGRDQCLDTCYNSQVGHENEYQLKNRLKEKRHVQTGLCTLSMFDLHTSFYLVDRFLPIMPGNFFYQSSRFIKMILNPISARRAL